MNNKKTLIVHHFEETWTTGMEKFAMTPEKMRYNLADFLLSSRGRGINHVIFTKFECDDVEELHNPLLELLDRKGLTYEFQVFCYASERDMFEFDAQLIPSTKEGASEESVVCIEPWHKELANDQVVMLCGAFEGECVKDAEDMLNFIRPNNYVKLNDLVIGTGVDYEPAICPIELEADYQDLCCQVNELTDEEYITPGSIKKAKGLIKVFLKDKNKGLLVNMLDQMDITYIHNEEMQQHFNQKLGPSQFSGCYKGEDMSLS